MKLPEIIKIGQVQYTIRIMEADGNFGVHYYRRARISLDDEMAEEIMPFTLWHEIIHALLYQAGYKKTTLSDEENDFLEKIITTLPFGIVQVLRDNPVLREL